MLLFARLRWNAVDYSGQPHQGTVSKRKLAAWLAENASPDNFWQFTEITISDAKGAVITRLTVDLDPW
jgi:hypothetical protein